MYRIKHWAWATFLALVLSLQMGCGGSSLVVSGETLKASGQQFVKTGATFKEGCDVTKTIPQTDCQAFTKFGEGFKQSFPISIQLWNAARATNDPETQEGAEGVIKSLKGRLDKFDAKAPAKK